MRQAIKSAVLAALILLFAGQAKAQCMPGACTIAMTLSSDSSGVTLGGTGTNTATLSFNTMQAFGGTTPSGVTKTVGSTNWTVSTPFDVKVSCTIILTLLPCGNGVSPNFTLTAKLQTADATNSWKINSLAITSGGTTTLATAGTYFSSVSYTFALTIPFSEVAGTINNTVNFVATAN